MSTARPRPSFPAKLGKTSAKASPAAAHVSSAQQPLKPAATRLGKTEVPAKAQGLGLDSQVVRHKMVLKLQEQGITDPRVILAMGRFAIQSLLGSTEPMGKLRGRLHDFQGVPVVVTYPPAYLLRNQADKGKAWEDLCLALKVVQEAT